MLALANHKQPSSAPDAIVVGTQLDLVAALRDAGMRHVHLAGSADALCDALEIGHGAIIVVDARRRDGAPILQALAAHPELIDDAVVVVRGGIVSTEERNALERARAIVWCSERMAPRTLVALAQRYRLH